MRISEHDFAMMLRRGVVKLASSSGPVAKARTGGSGLAFTCDRPRSLSLTLPLAPRAKQRPRVFRVRHKEAAGDGGQSRRAVMAITPKETRRFERELRQMLALEMRRQGLPVFTHPVLVGMRAAFAGDETLGATAQRVGDLDNIEKAVLDAMNGVVYADDRLVVCKFAQKVFAPSASLTVTVAEARNRVIEMKCFEEIMSALMTPSAP